MKKIIILMFLLLIPLVSSVPPVTQLSESSMTIAYPKYEYIGLNAPDFELFISVVNDTDIMTSDVSCNLHMFSNNGTEIAHVDLSTYDFHHNVTVDSGNFTSKGFISYTITCNSSDEAAFANGIFEVNVLGKEFTQAQSILYIGLMGILIVLFLITLGGITMLPTKNTQDGELIHINKLKYIRPILYVIAYMLIMGLVFVGENVANAYLDSTLMFKFLHSLFLMMGYLMLPMVVLWFIYIFYSIFRDREVKNMLERGIGNGI